MTLTKVDVEKIIKTDLKNWELINSKIVRFIPRNDDISLGSIVEKIWELSEKNDHHPDILLTYSGIKITLFTHDTSGITQKDIDLARSIENID
jgi:4a-hydroxytetrahydrobiopterin dehydratase